MPTVGALFAGYGGLELGVASVIDTELVWVSEIDPAASRILRHHWPDVPNLGDITAVNWTTVPRVDILTGGSPCQDVSHAGKRAGMRAGTRSGLWASMCDAIDILRPSLVVWENVRGALSAEADSAVEPCPLCVGDRPGPTLRALGRVLGDLAELGYDAWWCGLRAADVGVCHGRFRVFLFATPANAGGGAEWKHSREPSVSQARPDGGDEPRGSGQWGDVGLTLLPTPNTHNYKESGQPRDWGGDLTAALLPTPTTRDHKGRNQRDDETCLTGALLPTPRATRGGSATETVELLPTPRATDGTKGGPNQRGSSGDLMLPSAVMPLLPNIWERPDDQPQNLENALAHVLQNWGEYETAVRRQEAMLGRTAPPPTEAGRKGGQRLSPQFVEWMMCLPDGWVTNVPRVSRNDQLKALGNGVVPAQCAAALQAFTHSEEQPYPT